MSLAQVWPWIRGRKYELSWNLVHDDWLMMIRSWFILLNIWTILHARNPVLEQPGLEWHLQFWTLRTWTKHEKFNERVANFRLPSYGGTSGWHHCWQKKNPSKDLDHSDPQKAACHHFQKIAPFDSHADVEHVELGLLARFLQTLTTLSKISPKAKDPYPFPHWRMGNLHCRS